MKVAHKNEEAHGLVHLWNLAKQHEEDNDWEAAATIYKQIQKKQPHHQKVYDRLMMVYRKQKAFKKEYTLIKEAISVFQKHYQPRKNNSPRISKLSSALMKATGLVDKKGESAFHPEPINKWQKRLKVVERKLAY